MNKTHATSFAATFGIHILLLTTAFIIGVNFAFIAPKPVSHKNKLDIGFEEKIAEPVVNAAGSTENIINQLPPVKDELWDELPDPPKLDANFTNTASLNVESLPHNDITRDNADADGETDLAASNDRAQKQSRMAGIFGKRKKGIIGDSTNIEQQYFGVKLSGKIIFLLDVSGSMGSYFGGFGSKTKLTVLIDETIKAIYSLDSEAEFECILYCGVYESWKGHCRSLWGMLNKATDSNKKEAEKWLKNPLIESNGYTPTFEALEWVCKMYQDDISKLFLVTDGVPTYIDSNPNSVMENTIRNLPAVWKFKSCELVCMNISGSKHELDFLKRLAESVGGSYVHIKSQ